MQGNPPWRRLIWTVLLLAVFQSMYYIPLPILNAGAREFADSLFGLGGFGILALGITPFVSGFVLVELYSVLTPWGRRVRRSGSEGRRQLNQWAIGVAILVCTVQTLSLTLSLENITTPGGLALVPNPGWATRLITLVTLTAASTAAFMLCNAITVRGLGNGFGLLILVEFLIGLFSQRDDLALAFSPYGPAVGAIVVTSMVVLVLVFFYFLKRRADYPMTDPAGNAMRMSLPAFPQGLVPVAWAYLLLSLPGAFGDQLPGMPYAAGVVLTVPLLSFLTLHFFSTRRRVEFNLPRVELPTDFEPALQRRFRITTAALTAAATGFALLEFYVLDTLLLPSFAQLAMVAAVALDLVSEWQFRTRRPDAVTLIELDNVHFALYLEKVLETRGIECLMQSFHLRSLLFFFGPLYKMNVLVPADRLEEAEETLRDLDPAIV